MQKKELDLENSKKRKKDGAETCENIPESERENEGGWGWVLEKFEKGGRAKKSDGSLNHLNGKRRWEVRLR